MQKKVKGLLVAGIVLCAAGTGLFALGAGMGGITYVGAADLNKMDADAKLPKGVTMEKTKIENFDCIEADLQDMDLKILPSGDRNYYLAYEVYRTENNDPLVYDVGDGTLRLSDHIADRRFIQVDISFIFYLLGKREMLYKDNEVVLYVPEDAVFEDSLIKLSDGDLEMEGFSGKNTELELSYGDMVLRKCLLEGGTVTSADGSVEASDLSCRDVQMQFQYGDMSLDHTFVEECMMKLSDGDMEAEDLAVWGNLEIENSYGDVEVQFAEECRDTLSMDLKTKYGEIDISGDLAKSGHLTEKDDQASYEKTAGSSGGMLKVECSDGDITLK